MTKYILLSTLGTALFYFIYKLFLANEKWFQFNRFYLLASLAITLLFPALDFKLGLAINPESPLIMEAQRIINETTIINRNNSITIEPQTSWFKSLLVETYFLGLSVFALRFVLQLSSLLKMCNYSSSQMQGFKLISNHQQNGVFSFFNYSFISTEKLNSEDADALLLHETVHRDQWHSADNLCLSTLKVIFWFNPLMWLYAKAIKQNHEYLADEICSQQLSIKNYQDLLLTLSQVKTANPIVSSFSFPKLKNRFIMMNKSLSLKNKNWKISLLLAAVISFGALSSFSWIPRSKPMVVVIDPGHGGKDHGVALDGLKEKKLVLQLSNELKKQAPEHNLKLLFTRNSDDFIELEKRAAFPKKHKADFYLSLHINQAPENKQGIEVYYSKKLISSDTLPNYFVAEKFAQNFSNQMQEDLQFLPAPFYVLKHVECPAILMECGFLSNENDRKKLLDPQYQSELAAAILKSIRQLKS